MGGVSDAVRACLLGAAMCSVCVGVASADVPIDGVKTILFFSGLDLWRHGSFSYGGLLWSPRGLDEDGFTLKLLLGGGQYRYVSGTLGNLDVTGQQVVAFVMPGWRFRKDRLTVTVFAGLDTQHHRLTPDDPASSLRGTKIGLRGGLELWFEPDAQSMIAADASVSSVGPSYSARLAFGWRAPQGFYLGPEFSGFSVGDAYNQWRAGLHVTALRTNELEWSAGVGWTFDSDRRDGLYGRLGVIMRR
jgi:hypothetical protein